MAIIIFLPENRRIASADPQGRPNAHAITSEMKFIFIDRNKISKRSLSPDVIKSFASFIESSKISYPFFHCFKNLFMASYNSFKEQISALW